MRGQNVRCRLEEPLDTKTATGGRTRTWPNLPEFPGAMSPLSATEQELWQRNVQNASYKLLVMARSIPEQHRDKVTFKNRIVVINSRNALPDEVYDIVGVNIHRRAGRLSIFEIILGKVE